RQAGILPKRSNHRDADFREDVDRRARRGKGADNEKQKRKDNERVRAPQSDADQRSHKAPAPRIGTNARRRGRRNKSPPAALGFPLCGATYRASESTQLTNA